MNYRRSEAKEAARAQFRGLWAAITTPFTPDDRLDESGLRRNMRYFTDQLGVDGIFCTGTMGEFWSLTREERLRAVEIVVEEARGKCKVIAHTGHHSPNETVELTRHAQEVGADFAIVINPYYPAANEDMIYEWFAAVASDDAISGAAGGDVAPFAGNAGGAEAATPRSSKSTKRLEPWLLVTGFWPGARVNTMRTSDVFTSGCWNAWIIDTGPPCSGKSLSEA